MKSSRLKIGALVLTMSLVMGGCGEKPYKLTDNEEAIIVNYAAHVVSKYNKRQPDGLANVVSSESDKTSETETETQKTSTDDKTQSASTEKGQQDQTKQKTTETLTKALGLDGLTASYKGVEITNSYTEPKYYSLDATSGNTFLIIHITLENKTDKAIDCDLISGNPVFTAVINDSVTVEANTTILLNDLGTYQATIVAGASTNTVLLFEIPADQITSVEQLELKIEMNGTSSDVEL